MNQTTVPLLPTPADIAELVKQADKELIDFLEELRKVMTDGMTMRIAEDGPNRYVITIHKYLTSRNAGFVKQHLADAGWSVQSFDNVPASGNYGAFTKLVIEPK